MATWGTGESGRCRETGGSYAEVVGGVGFNMHDTCFFEGCNISFLKTILTLAYKNVTQLKCINKTETETNDARYGSSLVAFTIKNCDFVYTIRQSLINKWPLSRGHFGSQDALQWPFLLWRDGR